MNASPLFVLAQEPGVSFLLGLAHGEDSASTAISSRHANARDDAIAISRHADAHHANARDDAISRHANARDDANAKARRDDADAGHADSGRG